ncbi:GFA family protein [Phenylobacterium aquaticum]|uniref:GFA family protein n=1 Tax=Phenylobacterium aquaticum TaxID=1763816 RepID=UPI001F5D7508|nr:GFA family protein [Phenylobacterium aquaticum]MCI3133203.1 GFA family protein [Phenylobacterium aquaticum]
MPPLPLAGGCRCGQVRFEISAPPLITMACHCRGCQRMTASAFSLSVLVPAAGFTVTAGEPVIGGLHGSPKHFHCPHCMSWMFTRPTMRPTWSMSGRPCWTSLPGLPRSWRPA